MAIVLFDTNIIIDHLNGIPEATAEIAADYHSRIISTITWMEVACKLSPAKISDFRVMLLLADIGVVQTTEAIMVRSAALRGATIGNRPRKGLPDCIIHATAEVEGRIVITRNPKDFGGEGLFVRVPYDFDDATRTTFNVRPPLV